MITNFLFSFQRKKKKNASRTGERTLCALESICAVSPINGTPRIPARFNVYDSIIGILPALQCRSLRANIVAAYHIVHKPKKRRDTTPHAVNHTTPHHNHHNPPNVRVFHVCVSWELGVGSIRVYVSPVCRATRRLRYDTGRCVWSVASHETLT